MVKIFRHDMLETSGGCKWSVTGGDDEEDKITIEAIRHILECEEFRSQRNDVAHLYFIVKNKIEIEKTINSNGA